MTGSRDLRRKERVSYHVSDPDDSESLESPSTNGFGTPQKPRRVLTIDSEDDEEIEIEPDKTPPPRVSLGHHFLRQRRQLQPSLRAQENGDRQRSTRRKVSRPSRASLVVSDAPPEMQMSARNEIRNEIATETARKRANFFVAKKDYFLPLLPETNHVKRLVDEHSHSVEGEEGEKDLSVPYEALEHQPLGVKAQMKPYQLSGLSFLIYLNRNGLSGILGDEMGLGKTLQTLSLFQYLKENRKKVGSRQQSRPCLVVCPLSVLSSWIAESRRWTPELKVLRFHGPMRERARLKRIASGEEDMYGNETQSARRKKNSRRNAIGKPSDPDDEALVDEPPVDIVVTTYEGYLSEQNWFKRAFVWSYVVLDEGHKIKNDLSLISKALQGLGAEYRLILTGTPLQNNLTELWALLHWLYPEVFIERTSELFRKAFNLTRGEVSTDVMDDSRRLLELIMLRRMKNSKGVDLNLPPKTDVLLFAPLTPMQRFWYHRLLTRADDGLLEELFQGAKAKEESALKKEEDTKTSWIDKDIVELEALDRGEGGTAGANWEESKAIMRQAIKEEQTADDTGQKGAWKKLMNLLMQLRKCCNHPYLLPRAEPDPYYLGNHIIHASAKFIVLEKIINELVVKQRKKVLIFSGFTKMLDVCEDFLSLRGGNGENFQYLRLDGGTGRARRNLGIRMFNQADSNYLVMLISTRAGGLGINLATASDVIMLDQDWNPQIMLQAEARAHRIGQTKPVTVYKLCTQGTVEEQMMGRIQKKLYLSAKVTEGMRDIHTSSAAESRKRGPRSAADEDMPQLDTSQLVSLVRRGAQALAHPELDINEMLSWDWPTMLEKCKDKPADIHISEQTTGNVTVREEDEKKWLSQMEHVESRVFQGKRYTKEKDVNSYSDIKQEWSREERRKGKNTTVMVDGYAVSKESMLCGDWEAVPTFAGKDPRLAQPKREKKKPLVNQEHCQVCWDGGELILCSLCPRSYHFACLDKDSKARSKGKMGFSCNQHQCLDCEQRTTDAGGMIFRCRWCENGYCEDCLDWEKTDLIGENLKEYDLIGFAPVSQAFYISCPACNHYHTENKEAKDFCANIAFQYDLEHDQFLKDQALVIADAEAAAQKAMQVPSRPESLTDATTLETLDNSGISTPQLKPMDDLTISGSKKRKAAPNSFILTPTKRKYTKSTLVLTPSKRVQAEGSILTTSPL